MIENLYAGFLNMDHRTDRLQHMENQFKHISIKPIRHRGKKPQEYDLSDHKVQKMLNRTPGAIGCQFGQMEIMQTAYDIGCNALVLEDDVCFCEDFDKRLKYIDEWIGDGTVAVRDWDIIWLGGTFHVPAFWHKIGGSGMPPNCSLEIGHDCMTTDDERMIRTFGAFSTFAYIVNVNSIEKVLKLLNDFMPNTIGIDFSFIALGNKLNTFAFVPGCCKQIDNRSDIGQGDTIFSGFSKLNGTIENSRYWYQERMEDFQPSTFNFNL